MKRQKVSSEVREQIINRIKNEGVSVSQAAKEHGLDDSTIYYWIAKKTESNPSISELLKLKRENGQLKMLLGEITIKLSEAQKKK